MPRLVNTLIFVFCPNCAVKLPPVQPNVVPHPHRECPNCKVCWTCKDSSARGWKSGFDLHKSS